MTHPGTKDLTLGAVLNRAFFSDPAIAFAVPDDNKRRAMEPWFSGIVRLGHRYGHVDTLEDAAAAVWLTHEATFFEHVFAGLTLPTLALGPGAMARFLRMSGALNAVHHRLCPEPHHYLYFVGVDPSRQKQGLGSRLIRKSLERADADHQPCWLETATEANVGLYLHLGFQVAHEENVVSGGPRFWLMKRPAR
jgi:ribosomal protein S18 acetylase RimI-like enzyme